MNNASELNYPVLDKTTLQKARNKSVVSERVLLCIYNINEFLQCDGSSLMLAATQMETYSACSINRFLHRLHLIFNNRIANDALRLFCKVCINVRLRQLLNVNKVMKKGRDN